MSIATKIRPFSSGTEYNAWVSVNCDGCPLCVTCDICDALAMAYLDDGLVDAVIAQRAGLPIRYGATEADADVECHERLLLDDHGALPVDVVLRRRGDAELPRIEAQ